MKSKASAKKKIYDWEQKVIFLCILTIGLAAGAAWVTIWLTQPPIDPIFQNVLPKSRTVKLTPETGKYLEVKEYKIKVPVLVGMEDVTYKNISGKDKTTGEFNYIAFESAEVTDWVNKSADTDTIKNCLDKEMLALGTYSRFKGYPDGSEMPIRFGTYVLGDYYLAYQSPQDSCTNIKSIQKLVDKKTELIAEAFDRITDSEGQLLPVVQQGSISGSYLPNTDGSTTYSMCAELTDKSKSYCQTFYYEDPKFVYGIGYEIMVPAGDYYVYATASDNPRNPKVKRAYYDKAVLCGMLPKCTDKTPVTVHVTSGAEHKNIDPISWH